MVQFILMVSCRTKVSGKFSTNIVNFYYSQILQLFLVSSMMASPVPTTEPLLETTVTPEEPQNLGAPKSRQLLVNPVGDSFIIPPVREKQPLVEEQEDPNSMFEIINDGPELLKPSENVIFRPLFTYRTLQEQKRRRNLNKESTTRRPATSTEYEENSIKRRSSVYNPVFQPYPQVLPYYDVPFYYYNGAYYYYPNF